MTYNDKYTSKLYFLIRNPKVGVKKILPFIKSQLFPYFRFLAESFGIEKYSKPYLGHKELLEYVNIKDRFFVQCGGNDGYGSDPTYYLEKILGWKGVIVEPLSIYKLCQKNRNKSNVYNYAVGSFDQKEKTVSFVDCNLMSFVSGSIENNNEWIKTGEQAQQMKSEKITVPMRPVQELIDDYFSTHDKKTINLFVADVEGYELQVIKGLDFKKNKPLFILLEIHTQERLDSINEYLTNLNYHLIKEIGHHDYLFTLNQ